ncbi:MAG: hypothetical protein RL238_2768, partial [Actinomycetota bacterium]
RPSSSAAAARGGTPNTSNSRPSPGSTGSTTADFTANSATSRPPSSKPSTTLETGANDKPQHPPGSDAKDRPVQAARTRVRPAPVPPSNRRCSTPAASNAACRTGLDQSSVSRPEPCRESCVATTSHACANATRSPADRPVQSVQASSDDCLIGGSRRTPQSGRRGAVVMPSCRPLLICSLLSSPLPGGTLVHSHRP